MAKTIVQRLGNGKFIHCGNYRQGIFGIQALSQRLPVESTSLQTFHSTTSQRLFEGMKGRYIHKRKNIKGTIRHEIEQCNHGFQLNEDKKILTSKNQQEQ